MYLFRTHLFIFLFFQGATAMGFWWAIRAGQRIFIPTHSGLMSANYTMFMRPLIESGASEQAIVSPISSTTYVVIVQGRIVVNNAFGSTSLVRRLVKTCCAKRGSSLYIWCDVASFPLIETTHQTHEKLPSGVCHHYTRPLANCVNQAAPERSRATHLNHCLLFLVGRFRLFCCPSSKSWTVRHKSCTNRWLDGQGTH
jgi:hypothetical protein